MDRKLWYMFQSRNRETYDSNVAQSEWKRKTIQTSFNLVIEKLMIPTPAQCALGILLDFTVSIS